MSLDRREFLKSGGSLIVGFSLGSTLSGQGNLVPSSRAPIAGPPDPKMVDTWLAVHADNTATFYIGFAELGQGASTALLQIAAEELDLDMDQLRTVRLDTSITPNQGGTYASAAIHRGGPQIRAAAAEARRALLQLASDRLGIPGEQLTVSRGVVSGPAGSRARVTYGELAGEKPLRVPFTGTAPVKPASSYRVVGKPAPRNDVPAKIAGRYTYMQFVRVPGMSHGRVVRPRGQRGYASGAGILAIDESSIRGIPTARVLRKGDFLGVVAENEWDAIRAARSLQVTWKPGNTLPPTAQIHQTMLADTKANTRVVLERGNIETAFREAPYVFSQEYRGPYQAHGLFGPNCAIADVTANSALLICSSQDVYSTRAGVARVLGMPTEKVRVQFYEGSGTYGRSCYDDVAQAAAILSQLAGRPVRLQFMREDEHGWDNYGPAHVGKVRAAADRSGRIVAYEYQGWQHNWTLMETTDELVFGKPQQERNGGGGSQQVSPSNLGAMYDIGSLRLITYQLPNHGYLRAGWLRSPLDLSFSFASEQAIDDLAHQARLDPCQFRRQNIRDPRWSGVLEAVAKAAAWTPRIAGSQLSMGRILRGRGIALGTHTVSYGAAVAEIEVDRETGVVIARHMFGAIDAGLVVNPAFVENQISGQLVQTASRLLKEEVKFGPDGVTSLDWESYPVLRFDECPEVTAVVVQRLDQPSTGAGEEVMAAAAGAVANAFFDATGIRMTEYPMTPPRVLQALKAAQ